MSCAFEHDDGAYVLGALSPADRRAFEAHLSTCDRCQRSVRELAGLPGLLSRVDAEVLESPDLDEDVPAGLLPALLRDVRRERRRRTWLTVGAAAAAAALVATASFAVAGLNDSDGEQGATPSATPSATTGDPAPRPMTPVGDSGVRATLGLTSVAWGTRLDLTCSYDDADHDYASPEAYALVVHTRDGGSQQVATWKSLPGRTMQLAAATSATSADIASVEVQTSEGRSVLQLLD